MLPGVDARVHYSSVTDSSSPQDSSLSSVKKALDKHASLYISVVVQPFPDEMLLRPAILDFIDKAINPIVSESNDLGEEQVDSKSTYSEVEHTTSSFVSSSATEYSSFPVDIVVVVRVQPSSIRISCLPTSRVECLMTIPSLDIAFSSKANHNKSLKRSSIPVDTKMSGSSSERGRSYDSGGIIFTMCLSRFSLSIYHPYGKQHTVASKTMSAPEDYDHFSPKAKIRITQPQTISGKKDALSLCLEYMKFNLSRRRVGDVMSTCQDQHGLQSESRMDPSTKVKVSGIWLLKLFLFVLQVSS